jgi:hypothetical protein
MRIIVAKVSGGLTYCYFLSSRKKVNTKRDPDKSFRI